MRTTRKSPEPWKVPGCFSLRGECIALETPEKASEFIIEDTFSFRLHGSVVFLGPAPEPRPQPATVALDLARARKIQSEMDREQLTYREVAPRHGVSHATIGRLQALTRLAPDIQDAVARLTRTTASEAIHREDLERVAEAMDWTEQRARFQEVINRYYEPVPAGVARELTRALEMRKEIEERGFTVRRAATMMGMNMEPLVGLLSLTNLAPDIQKHVLAMTRATASWNVTAAKLKYVAAQPTHADQRRLYEQLLAGQLRSTRAHKSAVRPVPPEETAQVLADIKTTIAEKTKLVEDAVEAFKEPFALKQLCAACPGVTVDFVRRILQMLRAERRVTCEGMGLEARWRKVG
jgi:hypothetical protein